jgi:hypothetical protein
MKFSFCHALIAVLVGGCANMPVPKQVPAAVSLEREATSAVQPAVDFRTWRGAITGPTTKVATLGSIHLSKLGKDYDPTPLGALIDKLAAFRPDIITHEGLSGEQCELVKRHEKIYPSIYNDYCYSSTGGTAEGEKATGLTMPQAREQAEALLKSWPTTPSPAQRRKLASLFFASGDRNSAVVQWLQLPDQERHVGDGLSDKLIAMIEAERKRVNETSLIGVVLAARLGHQRIYAVDDHTSDAVQATAPAGYEAAVQAHWASDSAEISKNPVIARYEKLNANMTTAEGVISMYRYLQAPETQRAFVEEDFLAALKMQSPELYGRQYVAWYEIRNLRMVANVRAAFANKPGARVLNLVGASHKAYYDTYLDMMSEVEIVDTVELLK